MLSWMKRLRLVQQFHSSFLESIFGSRRRTCCERRKYTIEYMEREETTPLQQEKVSKVVTRCVVSVRTSLTSGFPVVPVKGGDGVAIMQQRREKSITSKCV